MTKLEIRNIIDKGHYFEAQVELPDFRLRCYKFLKGQGFTEEKEIDGVKKPRWMWVIEQKMAKSEELAKEIGKKPADYEKHFKKFRRGLVGKD